MAIELVRVWTNGAFQYVAQEAAAGGSGGGSLTDLDDVTGSPETGSAPVYDGSGDAPLTLITTQEDLEGVLAQVASVERLLIGGEGAPPFLSQFRNIGDPWAPASFRQLANSTLRLEGTVMCQDGTIADATWIPIFTLPEEAAPGVNLEFFVLTNDNAISKVFVWDDGQVIWGGYAIGTHAPISRLPLNSISWSIANP